ncbi:MAG: hypothetical protein ACI845_002185 [Gammaproteobacteria bacterium]
MLNNRSGGPEKFIDSAVRFPQPYSVANYASLSKETSELYLSSPLLFWLLVRHSIEQNWEDPLFIKYAAKKRTEILTLVSNSPEIVGRSAVKFLEKVQYEKVEKGDSSRLLDAISSGSFRSLSRHKYPSMVLLAIAEQFPEIIDARWILKSEIMKDDPEMANSIVSDILTMSNTLECVAESEGILLRKSNWEKVLEYHNELVSKFNDTIEADLTITFPEPPMEGSVSIIPVTDSVLLADEGIEQNNCVYCYLDLIAEGSYYVYQVHFYEFRYQASSYERATLGLSISLNGEVSIDQLLGEGNCEVRFEMKQFVKEWFENHNSRLLGRKFVADYKERQFNNMLQEYHNYSHSSLC